jgi:preprotein translocase subunit SecA
MDSLRNSIGLRAYGQRDPLIEYKAEAFKMFEDLMTSIKSEICRNIFLSASSLMAFENFLRKLPQKTLHQETSAFGGQTTTNSSSASGGADMITQATEAASKAKPVRTGPKVGRNDPCPCGSGKKFKQCCGKNF